MKPRTWADGNPTGALRRAYELMDELDAIVDKFGKKATEGALLEDLGNIIGDEAEIAGFKSEVAFIRMEEAANE